jgi:hypothetical protein
MNLLYAFSTTVLPLLNIEVKDLDALHQKNVSLYSSLKKARLILHIKEYEK